MGCTLLFRACRRAEGQVWIASTSLAAALGGASGSDIQEVTEGFIVVETNYRVSTKSRNSSAVQGLRHSFAHGLVQ